MNNLIQMVNDTESKGFIEKAEQVNNAKGIGKVKLGLIGGLLTLLCGCSGFPVLGTWRVAYKQIDVGRAKRPTPISAYNALTNKVNEKRAEIAKNLGISFVEIDDPIYPDFSKNLFKKAEEALKVDLTKEHLDYSLEDIQAIYWAVHRASLDDISFNTLERKIVYKLIDYHLREGLLRKTPSEKKYENYVTAACCALFLNDMEAFDRVYLLMRPYRKKKIVQAADLSQIAVMYPDIWEGARAKWARDRKRARLYAGITFGLGAGGGAYALGGAGSGGANSGGGPGSGAPGGN